MSDENRQIVHPRDLIRPRCIADVGRPCVFAGKEQEDVLTFGDSFDGTPNSDYHKGEEAALRAFARAFGFEQPSEDDTQNAALFRLGRAYPDGGAAAAFVSAVRAGVEWEGRG